MANGRLKTASFGTGFLGAVLLFCGFAAVAWIFFRFAAPTPTFEEKRAQERRDKVATINEEAQKKLYGPAQWIDKTKGTVQLPIDVAMDLVVNDYQQKTVQPSQVKVEVPYPAGLQAPAAAAAAAAPAPMAAGAKGSATPAAPASPAAPAAPAAPATPAPSSPSPAPEVKK
jgi:cytoskeletal protein RodZ